MFNIILLCFLMNSLRTSKNRDQSASLLIDHLSIESRANGLNSTFQRRNPSCFDLLGNKCVLIGQAVELPPAMNHTTTHFYATTSLPVAKKSAKDTVILVQGS
ncbi:hypothetical protein AMTR_s00062p00110550 [Amborella trichopoda]|uniref:Cupin type-1 domain-containing protein n=1 Tax=Amborella trichopoda TaxID=13333 RepID=U5DDU5_AMBTC|nr:hypothetical protein AMTR_s00062p00110550 [Amborella trichopoda]